MDEEKGREIPTAPELGSDIKQAVPIAPPEAETADSQAVPEVADSQVVLEEADLSKIVDKEEPVVDDSKQFDPGRGDYVDNLNDTTPPPPPERKPDWPQTERAPKKKHGGRIAVIIIVILLVAGAAYYWFGMRKPVSAPAKPKAVTGQTATSTTQTTPAKVATTHYNSANFSMGLDYPSTWKINDTTALLSITSPQVSLTTADGKQVNGYVYVTIQPKQATLPDFAKGDATAAIESQKITYKSPTQNQRAQTYITFASYATTASNGWDALYITGDNGYQVGQNVPMSDIVQTDPLVTVKFIGCQTDACTGTTTPYSLQASEWKNSAISAPLLALFESFSFD